MKKENNVNKMKIRPGISAIIYYEDKKTKKREYLILKRKKNWRGWEFLKGGIKPHETEKQALRREIKEEIGVSKFKSKRTNLIHKFKFKKEYIKDGKKWDGEKNRIYIIQLPNKEILVDHDEHSGFKWILKNKIFKMLKWKDYIKIIRKLIN